MKSQFIRYFVLVAVALSLFACKKTEAGKVTINKAVDTKQKVEYIDIMSLNANNFGEEDDEKIEMIADLGKSFHIIALQEINTNGGPQGVAKLQAALNRKGSKWECYHTERSKGTTTERFANCIQTPRLKYILLDTKEKIGTLSKHAENISRPPAIAIYEDKVTGKSFRLTSVHLAPENKDPGLESTYLVGDEWFNDPNSIILGDFNMPAKKMTDIFETLMGFDHLIDSKTSLKSKVDKKGNYLSKAFDNIFVKDGIKVIDSGVIDYVPSIGLERARVISDHLPVRMRFMMK